MLQKLVTPEAALPEWMFTSVKTVIENLQIAFDGRYRIEELLDILEEAIQDFEAQMGLRMAARLNDVVTRIAKHLNKIFTGLSATVAVTPIPTSDIYLFY